MTKADELNALADRCEREEPSRALDCAIAQACLPREGGKLWTLERHIPPDYTTSLDAVATLEPKDALEICVRIYANKTAYVRITRSNGRPVYCESFNRPITEVMARCATALRAMAAELP